MFGTVHAARRRADSYCLGAGTLLLNEYDINNE